VFFTTTADSSVWAFNTAGVLRKVYDASGGGPRTR
jgi:hypothetical protein